jgi:hypothetical protein
MIADSMPPSVWRIAPCTSLERLVAEGRNLIESMHNHVADSVITKEVQNREFALNWCDNRKKLKVRLILVRPTVNSCNAY